MLAGRNGKLGCGWHCPRVGGVLSSGRSLQPVAQLCRVKDCQAGSSTIEVASAGLKLLVCEVNSAQLLCDLDLQRP